MINVLKQREGKEGDLMIHFEPDTPNFSAYIDTKKQEIDLGVD